MTDSGIAKLADFGCSKQLHGIQSSSLEDSLRVITGSVPWMAPEVIKQSGRIPKAAGTTQQPCHSGKRVGTAQPG